MRLAASLTLWLLFTGAVALAGADPPAQADLKRLTLEELMNLDVTLAARRPEPVASTPAAISVVTGEDIRRSGVTTLADAVGLADGVHVARFNNGSWSIAARGFNGVTSNKLLVMIDGRTVYSPLFTGVFWNALDYPLEDIERIEVIRGPGATLWGANAVNGVVNIITRHSRDTLGTIVQVGAGNEDPNLAEVRYGGRSASTTYRTYARFVTRASQKFTDGSSSADRRRRGQVGFRLDAGTPQASTWLLKGDALFSSNHFADRDDGEFKLFDLQGRWTRALSARSELQVQAYLNHEYRKIPLQLTHRLTTADIELQHAFTASRHSVVWGGGIRRNQDSTEPTATLEFDPPSRTYPVSNLFVQDDIAVRPDLFYVTAGAKVERNAFSGAEFQPSIRARVLLRRSQTVWGGVSRAVRRPTRFEDDIVILTDGVVILHGNDDFRAETLIATELGYRLQPTPTFSADVTLFRHDYDRIRSQEAPAGPVPIPLIVGNTLNGVSSGVELGLNLQPAEWWRIHAGYTHLRVSLSRDPDSRDVSGGSAEANDPEHIFGLRSSIDLPHDVEFDARLRSIGALPNPAVPGYTELVLRGAWRPTRQLEFSIIGDDLLHDRHPEFIPTARGYEEFERGVRGMLTVRF
jgi:iron complex outermembrane receptor protein